MRLGKRRGGFVDDGFSSVEIRRDGIVWFGIVVVAIKGIEKDWHGDLLLEGSEAEKSYSRTRLSLSIDISPGI